MIRAWALRVTGQHVGQSWRVLSDSSTLQKRHVGIGPGPTVETGVRSA